MRLLLAWITLPSLLDRSLTPMRLEGGRARNSLEPTLPFILSITSLACDFIGSIFACDFRADVMVLRRKRGCIVLDVICLRGFLAAFGDGSLSRLMFATLSF